MVWKEFSYFGHMGYRSLEKSTIFLGMTKFMNLKPPPQEGNSSIDCVYCNGNDTEKVV